MEEEQALNNENLNNEETMSSSSNSTLKDVASNVADAVRDRKYKSRKNNTSNIDSSSNSDSKGNSSKAINPANKLKNNLKNQVANRALNVANLHPAVKTAMMLNNIRKNGLFNKQKKNENDSSSNDGNVKDTSNDNNNSTPDSNENEKSSFNPVSSLLGSNFKGKFSFLGRIPLKIKIAILASGFFLTIFIAILAPVIIVSAFDSLLEIDDGSSSSGSGGSNVAAGSYVEWAINIANDDSHGYSQCNRTGPDYDCSSFVYYSLLNSGYSKGDIGTYPFSSSNQANVLAKIGFKKHSYVESELQSGDILWRSGHTGIYIGDGKIVHASIGENGTKCGKTGDQTGKEILVTTNTGRWTAYFRKEG